MKPWANQDNPEDESVYISGQCAPPGFYWEVGSNVVILLDHFQALPAPDDGGQIEYRRLFDHPTIGITS
jgi:hypothetical protein